MGGLLGVMGQGSCLAPLFLPEAKSSERVRYRQNTRWTDENPIRALLRTKLRSGIDELEELGKLNVGSPEYRRVTWRSWRRV